MKTLIEQKNSWTVTCGLTQSRAEYFQTQTFCNIFRILANISLSITGKTKIFLKVRKGKIKKGTLLFNEIEALHGFFIGIERLYFEFALSPPVYVVNDNSLKCLIEKEQTLSLIL